MNVRAKARVAEALVRSVVEGLPLPIPDLPLPPNLKRRKAGGPDRWVLSGPPEMTRYFVCLDFLPKNVEISTDPRVVQIEPNELEATLKEWGYGSGTAGTETPGPKPVAVGSILYFVAETRHETNNAISLSLSSGYGTRAGVQVAVRFEIETETEGELIAQITSPILRS